MMREDPALEVRSSLCIRAQLLGALAFAGDLSMGQPVDHSPRTALLAACFARATGSGDRLATSAARLALLRWAGCTANAREFADLFGDDIAGRAAMLANRNPFVARAPPALSLDSLIRPLATAHCEASAEIAGVAGFGDPVRYATADLFEWWDGSGFPRGKRGEDIDQAAQLVSLSGDIEVLVRVYGLTKGLALVESRAGTRYDPDLVRAALRESPRWLDRFAPEPWIAAAAEIGFEFGSDDDLAALRAAEILGDLADLKIPSAAMASRRAADLAASACRSLGAESLQDTVRLGALLHGLGRVSVPNPVLEKAEPLSEADWELVRLIPYWTGRILGRAPVFREAAELACQAYERLDASGYHRGLGASQISPVARVLQSAVAFVDLFSRGAGHNLVRFSEAALALEQLVSAGRLDEEATRAVLVAGGRKPGAPSRTGPHANSLTEREREVLVYLAKGYSNKEIARTLQISPSTAGTHVENIYRKLSVSTRAAVALKAASLGVLA